LRNLHAATPSIGHDPEMTHSIQAGPGAEKIPICLNFN